MTAIRGYVPPSANEASIGIHSLDQFVLTVPDLTEDGQGHGAGTLPAIWRAPEQTADAQRALEAGGLRGRPVILF